MLTSAPTARPGRALHLDRPGRRPEAAGITEGSVLRWLPVEVEDSEFMIDLIDTLLAD
jgi:hypothetical protein